MQFQLFKRILINEKYRIIINSIFIALLFSLLICLLSFTFDIRNKFEKMIEGSSVDVKLTETTDAEFSYIKENFNNYYYNLRSPLYVIKDNVVLGGNTSLTNLYYIQFVNLESFPLAEDEILMSERNAESFGLSDGDMTGFGTLDNSVYLKVRIGNENASVIMVSDKLYDRFKATSSHDAITVLIENSEQASWVLKTIEEKGLEVLDVDPNSVLNIYKSITVAENLLCVISIVIAIYAVFVLYSLMGIFLNKSNKFLGILRCAGTSNKNIFINSFLLILFLSLIGIVIGTLVSLGFMVHINDVAYQVFDIEMEFCIIWYVPVLVFFGLNLLFLLFFGSSMARKIRISNIIDLLRGGA